MRFITTSKSAKFMVRAYWMRAVEIVFFLNTLVPLITK